MGLSTDLGAMAQMQLEDPIFSEILWKMTPVSLAMRLTKGRFQPWHFVQLLSRKLVDVVMGRCPRLIICMPPRSGKSVLVSQWFNVWMMENFPSRKVILASYEADFAAKWGQRVRDAIIENQDVLSVRFGSKNPAMHHFETTEGGSMSCAGVGGAITGKGCNVLIVDDYCKNPSAKCDLVMTSDGSSKTLGSLEIGDLVVTHVGRPKRVAEIFERGMLECVRITTFSGRVLTVALTHPCLTLLGWERGGDLEVGDRLCIPKTYSLETSTYRKVEEFRLAGYIIGDGCCNKQVAMAVTDLEEREDFERCALAAGLKTTRPGKSRNAGALHVSGGIAWAQAAGMHGKVAATKVVPPWVFTSPDEHVANFIGAYFATDGCVASPVAYLNGLLAHARGGKKVCAATIRFDSVSKELLLGVQSLLSRFTIYSRLRPSRTRYRGEWISFWTLYITDSASVKLFAEKIPVHHSMKRVKLRGWLEYLGTRPKTTSVEVLRDIAEGQTPTGVSINALDNLWRGLSSGDRYSPIGNDYVYDRIVSIESCVEDCRCITVEEDHSFLANGLVVHNSEEANSLTMRQKTWDWWTSTARTRIEPFMDSKTGQRVQPGVIVIATRWHEDDLIGRLISKQFSNDTGERDEYEVFVFPACADPDVERYYRQFGVKVNDLRAGSMSGSAGAAMAKSLREQFAEGDNPEWRDILGRKRGEALCPERYNERDFALFKSTSLRDWYALFQQTPGNEADDGNVYYRFDERTHCKSLQRDESMQLFVSMDFNVNPMSVIIGQYDRSTAQRLLDRCEILEEIVLPNSNTMDMMGRLLMELKKYQWGYTLEVEVYGDAAGTQRSSQSQKSNWQIVAEYFAMDTSIHYRFLRKKANPMIVDRVNAVNTMLRSADGTVRLYVDDAKCPELLKDLKKVKWQTDSSGVSTGLLDKSDAKRTHISDAAGYAVEYLFALRGHSGGCKGILQ